LEIQRHGQLYSFERSQTSVNRMHSQEPRCGLKVLLFDWRPNNYSISSDVRSETTQGDRQAREVKNPGPNLYRQHGFEFHQ
jgi:hypothetical protein